MAINRACHSNNHNWKLTFSLLDQLEKQTLITSTLYKNQRMYIKTWNHTFKGILAIVNFSTKKSNELSSHISE